MRELPKEISEQGATADSDHRRWLDLLRSRIALLKGKDKVLMTMYFDTGNTVLQIAVLSGMSEARVARKIRVLTRRLMDGRYLACVRERQKFTKLEMALARDHFLRGLSYKKIARKRSLTLYRVKKILRCIKRVIENKRADTKCTVNHGPSTIH
jgi:hypothetical protein